MEGLPQHAKLPQLADEIKKLSANPTELFVIGLSDDNVTQHLPHEVTVRSGSAGGPGPIAEVRGSNWGLEFSCRCPGSGVDTVPDL